MSFDEATTVFTDPFAITYDDPDHSRDEKRFITIGTSSKPRILFLSHVDRGEDQPEGAPTEGEAREAGSRLSADR